MEGGGSGCDHGNGVPIAAAIIDRKHANGGSVLPTA